MISTAQIFQGNQDLLQYYNEKKKKKKKTFIEHRESFLTHRSYDSMIGNIDVQVLV